MSKIGVIGSLNMDLVAVADHFPKPGETVIGREFGTYPGGKGANQAVAAGRLGANVTMLGKVGSDFYGDQIKSNLAKNNVNTDHLDVEPCSTGVAVIEVDTTGENHIIIIPGANRLVDYHYIDRKLDSILNCDISLFQLEIPLETVLHTMKKLKEHRKVVVLDPAPARPLPDEIFQYIDYITPNETEAEILTGVKPRTLEDSQRAASRLIEKGVRNVIIKAGKKGAFLVTPQETTLIPGFKVNAVDTTAAGDSFNGGFAVALGRGYEIPECVRYANAVAALSTTAKGAQTAMPEMQQVRLLLEAQRN